MALSTVFSEKLVRRVIATGIVLGLSAMTAGVALEPAHAEADAGSPERASWLAELSLQGNISALSAPADRPPIWRPAPDWEPPTWHPEGDRLRALDGVDGEPVDTGRRAPRLSARSAFAYDLDSGEVLLSVRADERWPVASLTKLVSALAAATESPDLERVHCVDARWYPTRNGAFSKFSTGECYRGWDLLGSMLVASDNRGAYGMQVASGLAYDDFIARMNQVAADLGMSSSSFSDPSGLEDDNLSTARDMARAVVAAAYHPVVSVAANARSWETDRMDAPGGRTLNTTNRLAHRGDVEVLAAKTGYTDTARYCYTALVRTESGRRVAFSVIGANRSSQRWSDARKILDFVQ